MQKNKLKLGIDAKWYFDGPPSGRIVVVNLVDHMIASNNPEIEIYLFIDKNKRAQAERQFNKDIKLIFVKAQPNLLSNVFVLPYFANKCKIDIILFQNFGTPWFRKSKQVIYIHDFLFLDYPQFYSKKELLYFRPMRYLAKGAAKVITISYCERERLIKHNVAKAMNIAVVHHGINEKFKPKSNYSQVELDKIKHQYNLPEKYILYVGRINIRKNLLNLIKGMALLTDTTIKLVIVGKVDHKNIDITNYIAENSLKERIIFTDHVTQKNLYLIYAQSFIFCFPSFAEGFGLPPLEAMQCGIPVVVSNTTSLPEVCGEAALYVKPNDPKTIAEKLDLLLSDSKLYNEKQKQGLKNSAKYSWNKAADDILHIVSDL